MGDFLKTCVVGASLFAVFFSCSGLRVMALKQGNLWFLTTASARPANLLVAKLVENWIALQSTTIEYAEFSASFFVPLGYD
jgi:hypothetical protein